VTEPRARHPRVRLIVRKVFVSLAIGAVAYFITNVLTDLTHVDDPIWGLTLSVFVGGVALVVQFLNDFEARLTDVESAQVRYAKEIERTFARGFAKINDATELFGLVEDSPLASEAVLQLVRHSTNIGPKSPPLVVRFAQSEIRRMSQFLKKLGEGDNVIYDGEDRDWMLALARNAESTIDATSLPVVDAGVPGFGDGGLWASDLGQHYLEAQRDRIQNGVRIRRIIVLDRPGLANDPGLLQVYRHQREMGIDVRILDLVKDPSMRGQRLFDFVLFDDVISYEVTPGSFTVDDSIRPRIVHTRLELHPNHVADRVRRFRDLWDKAKEFEMSGEERVPDPVDRFGG